MADAKKEAPQKNGFEEIMLILFFLFFLSLLFARVQDFFAYWTESNGLSMWEFIKAYFLEHVWPIVELVAFIVSGVSIIGIAVTSRKMKALNLEEKELYGLKDVEISDEGVTVSNKNERWEKVLEHINSANSSDWRLAIIEADIMLDELLRASGYHGDTVGDMLKSVEVSDFLSVEAAWQAHKIRNRIAHSGADFHLNEREAKQAIALYESVFKEFKII